MSRTAAPPQNFGNTFNAVRGAVTGQPSFTPPSRTYTPNPFASQTPPPGPLPPGLSAGPPQGMSPSEFHSYRYMPARDRERQEALRALQAVILRNQQARRGPSAPPTSGGAGALAQALRSRGFQQ